MKAILIIPLCISGILLATEIPREKAQSMLQKSYDIHQWLSGEPSRVLLEELGSIDLCQKASANPFSILRECLSIAQTTLPSLPKFLPQSFLMTLRPRPSLRERVLINPLSLLHYAREIHRRSDLGSHSSMEFSKLQEMPTIHSGFRQGMRITEAGIQYDDPWKYTQEIQTQLEGHQGDIPDLIAATTLVRSLLGETEGSPPMTLLETWALSKLLEDPSDLTLLREGLGSLLSLRELWDLSPTSRLKARELLRSFLPDVTKRLESLKASRLSPPWIHAVVKALEWVESLPQLLDSPPQEEEKYLARWISLRNAVLALHSPLPFSSMVEHETKPWASCLLSSEGPGCQERFENCLKSPPKGESAAEDAIRLSQCASHVHLNEKTRKSTLENISKAEELLKSEKQTLNSLWMEYWNDFHQIRQKLQSMKDAHVPEGISFVGGPRQASKLQREALIPHSLPACNAFQPQILSQEKRSLSLSSGAQEAIYQRINDVFRNATALKLGRLNLCVRGLEWVSEQSQVLTRKPVYRYVGNPERGDRRKVFLHMEATFEKKSIPTLQIDAGFKLSDRNNYYSIGSWKIPVGGYTAHTREVVHEDAHMNRLAVVQSQNIVSLASLYVIGRGGSFTGEIAKGKFQETHSSEFLLRADSRMAQVVTEELAKLERLLRKEIEKSIQEGELKNRVLSFREKQTTLRQLLDNGFPQYLLHPTLAHMSQSEFLPGEEWILPPETIHVDEGWQKTMAAMSKMYPAIESLEPSSHPPLSWLKSALTVKRHTAEVVEAQIEKSRNKLIERLREIIEGPQPVHSQRPPERQ